MWVCGWGVFVLGVCVGEGDTSLVQTKWLLFSHEAEEWCWRSVYLRDKSVGGSISCRKGQAAGGAR